MMYFLPFWKSISPFSQDAAQPHDNVMCICNMPVPLWGRFFLLLQKALLAIRDETADTLARLRNLAVELRPPALDELGIELVCAVETVLGDVESVAVYRIVQECLTNIVRHSHATRAQICLTAEERIVLYVKDNGDGITPERIRAARRENHMGIYGIVERVRLLAGRMELSAELPEWTTVYRIELRGRGGLTDESDDCG